MEYRYESIENNLQMPIRIFTHTLEQFPYHWHEEVEILFVLNGTVSIFIDKEVTTLKEGDIFLINKNEIHYVKSTNYFEKSQLLVLQFNTNYLNDYGIDLNNTKFKLNSSDNDEKNKDDYNKIRGILAMMMNVVINKEQPYHLLIKRHLLDLIIVLINKFYVNEEFNKRILNESENRILDIVKYIDKNYKDNELTIAKIAKKFYLNPQYISRYFKDNIGVSIKEYTENLRLNKSLNDLKITKDRILDIANKHGFPDEKSYYRVFKKVIGITPNKYREINSIYTDDNNTINYLNINSKEALARIFEYLKPYNLSFKGRKINYRKKIKLNNVVGKLNNTWNKLVTFGHASYGLRNDLNNQLKIIQEDIKFEYIRFHGIFSDDMFLYNEKSNGDIYYNFNHIDTLIDEFLNLGLKPFIELGFMPEKLAKTKNKIFNWNAYISGPKDIKLWLDMINTFIKHIINRYGIDSVRSWYFEFWNEPNLEYIFWDGDREEFFAFFKETYFTIKNIDKHIKIGGFGNLKFGDFENWINEFKKYSIQNKCYLDFFSFHIYQFESTEKYMNKKKMINDDKFEYNILDEKDQNDNINIKEMIHIGNEEFVSKTVKEMVAIGNQLNLSNNEYWITEWNASMNCRDLVHDTCFMAAYIIKTYIENDNLVNGIGFWTFTDLFEEFRLGQKLFHGGFGLLTYNGIKKASYHAYEFLNKLHKDIVYKDDGLIITKKDDDYRMLFYNYCHYNDLYCSLDNSQISQLNRYDVFKNSVEKVFDLAIELKCGEYEIERFRVNREEGSAFDAWVCMGAPETLSKEGYKYLESAAQYGYKVWRELVENDLNISTILLPHEIQLISIKKLY